MNKFEEIFKRELELKERKKDYMVKKSLLNPNIDSEGNIWVGIGAGRDRLKMDHTGMSSYLSKIQVPYNFFKECSPNLKNSITKEFQEKVPNQDDNWRIRTLDKTVRFVASNHYAKFDNIDILTALSKFDLSKLEVKQYYDDGKYFVLRVCQKDPLSTEGRPFFAGIEISNSEVGMRSVKAACMLWEQVCTNGLTVPTRSLGSFKMIHAGEKRREIMEDHLKTLLDNFGLFAEQSRDKLIEAEETSGILLLNKLKNSGAITESMYETVKNKAKQYALDEEEPTYLDVISGYTESMQTIGWGERFKHEDQAGNFLWRIA